MPSSNRTRSAQVPEPIISSFADRDLTNDDSHKEKPIRENNADKRKA